MQQQACVCVYVYLCVYIYIYLYADRHTSNCNAYYYESMYLFVDLYVRSLCAIVAAARL